MTSNRKTPLSFAVGLDNVPIARRLLEHGADLAHGDKLDHRSCSALHAARSGEMVQLLLDNHADPELVVDNGYTPLHYYAARDNIEAMRGVLRNGVEVDPILGALSFTPLHYAVRHNADSAKLLDTGSWSGCEKEGLPRPNAVALGS
jgi:ankyrin repeat protein